MQKSRKRTRGKKPNKNAVAASDASLDGENGLFVCLRAPGELATTTNLTWQKKPKSRKESRKEEKQKSRKAENRQTEKQKGKEGPKGRTKRRGREEKQTSRKRRKAKKAVRKRRSSLQNQFRW